MAKRLLEIGRVVRATGVGGHPVISSGLWAAGNQAGSQLGGVASVTATRPNSSLEKTAVEDIVDATIREKQLTTPDDVKRILGHQETDAELKPHEKIHYQPHRKLYQ